MSELPSIPATWATVKLDDICAINERPFSPITSAYSLPVHFVPMAAVAEDCGGIDVGASRPMGEVIKGYTAFVQGDVLFAKITPCMENGKVALVPSLANHVGFGSTEFHVLRAGNAVTPEWIARYLSQLSFRKLARQDMSGSAGQLRVQTPWLASAPIPVAPLPEQRRILQCVDELLSDVDAGVAELTAAKHKLTLYRRSLLKSAVEGSLTAEWRARQAQVSVATPAASGDKWAEIPSTWHWSTAASTCGFITKGTTPPKSLAGEGARCVPFLRVTNLTHDGSLNFSDQVFVAEDVHRKFLARSIVNPGDVLMNIVGPPLGQVSLVPPTFPEWNVNQAIAIFRVQPGLLNEFLAYLLLSPGAGRWLQARAKTTAGQTNLTLEVCRSLPVPIPPLAEQVEIVRLLNQHLEALAEQGNAIKKALTMIAAQRQNILRAAFSGQLVPQDPNDEPASVLLDRIRAQRLARTAAPSGRRPRAAKERA